MSKVQGVGIVAILNSIDDGVMDAIAQVKQVIRNPNTKITERMTAANALIKMKATFFKIQKEQSFDKLDYELKQIRVKKERLSLIALEKAADPNATEEDRRVYSRVFTPAMKADGLNDDVVKEVL